MRASIAAAAFLAAVAPAAADGLSVTTPGFEDGGTIPLAQVCARYHGGGRSPALSWSGAPTGTKGFAITMYHPDAPTGSGFWHWTVFNIPASVHDLPAGAGDAGSTSLPRGAGQGRNDAGVAHYSGPCPPAGDEPHHYRITIYAVKVDKLPLDAESSGARVGFNLHFNTLASGRVTGLYGHPE